MAAHHARSGLPAADSLAIDRELAEYGNQLTKLGLRRLDLIGFGKSR